MHTNQTLVHYGRAKEIECSVFPEWMVIVPTGERLDFYRVDTGR
jgi:hypothetical protein